MNQTEIKALLEKYWQAETSLEEERLLTEYFRQAEIPAELEPIRGLFEWREEEGAVRPGADFDRRMLERIAEIEAAGPAETAGLARGADEKGAHGKAVRIFSMRFAAAAAVILCLGIGLLIPSISPGPESKVTVGSGPQRPATAIADTYTDPHQALAAVKKALLVASTRMNEGKHITQKNIARLQDTWQTAIGN